MDNPGDTLLQVGHLRLRPCRYGVMLYSLRDIYIGRSLDLYGEYSPAEARLYERLLSPGQAVVDAGANIGAFTLLFAHAVGPTGRVYAFEPQRLAFQMLCANLACNGIRNTEAWPAGLGESTGHRIVPALRTDVENNFGACALATSGPGETVTISTVDNLGLNACDLIKIDVQGMELDVLLGADATIARHRPVLYVENDQREMSAALIGHLFDLDYRLYWHLPPLWEPDNFRGEAQNVVGTVVNVNLLCLPTDDDERAEELRAVEGVDDWWHDD